MIAISFRRVASALSLAALLGLEGCGALNGAFEPVDLGAKVGVDHRIELQTLPIALRVDEPAAEQVGRLAYRGGVYINSPDRRFGGLSDLIVTPDGTRLVAISESGQWFSAQILSKDGRLTGLRDGRLAPMLDSEGKPLDRIRGAAKALAAGPEGLNGPLYVAFERKHRIAVYPFGKSGFAARPAPVDIPADAQRLAATGGIQGLLALDAHTLYAQSEDARDRLYDLQAWLVPTGKGGDQKPRVMFLKAKSDFKPTGLAALPNGDVLLLERSFNAATGATAQIRLIKRDTIQPLGVLDGEVVAKLDVHYSIDNMEGIAARTTETGETMIYLLSNDNFNGLQRTVLLSFVLREGAPSVASR